MPFPQILALLPHGLLSFHYCNSVYHLGLALGHLGNKLCPFGHFIYPKKSTPMCKCCEFSNINKGLGVKDKSSISQHPVSPHLEGFPPSVLLSSKSSTLDMSPPHCTGSHTQNSRSLPLRPSLNCRLAFPRSPEIERHAFFYILLHPKQSEIHQ